MGGMDASRVHDESRPNGIMRERSVTLQTSALSTPACALLAPISMASTAHFLYIDIKHSLDLLSLALGCEHFLAK